MINPPRTWNAQEWAAALSIVTTILGAVLWVIITIRVHDDRLDKLERDQGRLIDQIVEGKE